VWSTRKGFGHETDSGLDPRIPAKQGVVRSLPSANRGPLRSCYGRAVPTDLLMRGEGQTWLCPTEGERARVLENSSRVQRARLVASGVIGVSAIAAVPRYGWWMLAVFAVAVLPLQTLEVRMRRSPRPEYHAAFNILMTQVAIAVAAALTGGPTSPLLFLIVIPTAFAATRFRFRVTIVATVIPIVMLLIVTFGLNFQKTLDHPAWLVIAVDVIVGVSAACQALFGAEQHHRQSAILDPLTGLLNRQGLERRFEELAEQARLGNARVSVLICDLDHFKAINDSHGHAAGDAVLRDVAYELRKQLRSFELIYRIGGEEFLVVLPGASALAARALGEKLCAAARSCCSNGLSVTVSVGTATLQGQEVQFRPMFEAADRALYNAKRGGRDRVATADEPESPAAQADAPTARPWRVWSERSRASGR
jgi:diguanylate cyclase (GGDEF)-like protein